MIPGVGSFAALGDSFTEGVGDLYPDGTCQGWADRFARHLAAVEPGLRYANLAIRGKLLRQVLAEQIPVALDLRPGLVSLAAGGNDLLRPKCDADALAASFEQAVGQLKAAGCQVMVVAGFDPGGVPLLRLVRGKAAAYNQRLHEVARRHDCLLMDLWSMTTLADPRMWCADRLHLAPDGHRRVALRACEVMGLAVTDDWREPLPADCQAATGWSAARRQDARWAATYVLPWIRRRLRGISSGDGLTPKRPDLLPF